MSNKSFAKKYGWIELKKIIHEDSGVPKAQIDEVFGASISTMERLLLEDSPKLQKGDNSSKLQFMLPTGALTFRHRNSRSGFNPVTKQKIMIEPGVTMSVNPPKTLMVAANKHINIGSKPKSDPVKKKAA